MPIFNEPLLSLIFIGYLYGFTAMVQFHNTIVSIRLYKTRLNNLSNIFKLLFNLSGLLVYLVLSWSLIVPPDINLAYCKDITYMGAIAEITYKSTLSAFLLTNLNHFLVNNKINYWISII